ncbi:hypothetical protein GGS20DRAFT_529184 [Poronia punctata]|nr:hypothetical protein GGS20DRAFT_529184 [Poronia punctata]
MEPITKVWLFTLNERHSIIEATFSGFWNQTLMIAASYTTERGEPHILFQCEQEPDLFAVICGYHSLQASIDAEKALGERLAPKFADFITHKDLYVLNMDIRDLPVTQWGRIAMVISDSQPSDPKTLPGKGGWAMQMETLYVEPHDASKAKKTWVQITTADDTDNLEKMGDTRSFTMIMEAHIASEAA